MIVGDLLETTLNATELDVIRTECSQFLRTSAGLPLKKLLPSTYTNFCRVKIRKRKQADAVTEAFERAFGEQFYNLRQRALFAYSSINAAQPGYEPFYVFPVNGFKFMYCKEVTNSQIDYETAVGVLEKQLNAIDRVTSLVSDVIRYSYTSESMPAAIRAGAEVIVYGIPCFYAVRASTAKSYPTLLTNIR